MSSKGPVVKESFRFELDFCGVFLGVFLFFFFFFSHYILELMIQLENNLKQTLVCVEGSVWGLWSYKR